MVMQLFKKKTKKKVTKASNKQVIIKKLNQISHSKKNTEHLEEDLYEVTKMIKDYYIKEELTEKELKEKLKGKKWLLKALKTMEEYEYSQFIPTQDEIQEMNSLFKKHFK